MNSSSLFDPLQVGSITLPNRIIMAPFTRMRAGSGNIPNALNAEYYAQRASAGLIIAEGTAVSQQGQGYPNAPGIYTREQVDGWRTVTRAVHSRGGRMFLQIAHNGRNSHSSFMPDGGPPVAPSAIPPKLPGFTRDGQIGLGDALHADALNNARLFRPYFHGPLISAAAYTPLTANDTVEEKSADAVAFGRMFISNPDLVERVARDLPLSPYDRSTFYGGGEKGYTDYQASSEAV